MSKKSKSKRFAQYSADTVKQHDQQFPYRQRFSEVIQEEKEADNDYWEVLVMANMANNLFQQAKDAVNRITNGQNFDEQDKQAARTAIQSAYTNASPEEQQELQQLQQQLEQRNELK